MNCDHCNCVPKEKVVGKSCCSACGVQGHNKNNKKFHPVAPVCLPVTKEFPSNQICRKCEEEPIVRGESLCRGCFISDDDDV